MDISMSQNIYISKVKSIVAQFSQTHPFNEKNAQNLLSIYQKPKSFSKLELENLQTMSSFWRDLVQSKSISQPCISQPNQVFYGGYIPVVVSHFNRKSIKTSFKTIFDFFQKTLPDMFDIVKDYRDYNYNQLSNYVNLNLTLISRLVESDSVAFLHSKEFSEFLVMVEHYMKTTDNPQDKLNTFNAVYHAYKHIESLSFKNNYYVEPIPEINELDYSLLVVSTKPMVLDKFYIIHGKRNSKFQNKMKHANLKVLKNAYLFDKPIDNTNEQYFIEISSPVKVNKPVKLDIFQAESKTNSLNQAESKTIPLNEMTTFPGKWGYAFEYLFADLLECKNGFFINEQLTQLNKDLMNKLNRTHKSKKDGSVIVLDNMYKTDLFYKTKNSNHITFSLKTISKRKSSKYLIYGSSIVLDDIQNNYEVVIDDFKKYRSKTNTHSFKERHTCKYFVFLEYFWHQDVLKGKLFIYDRATFMSFLNKYAMIKNIYNNNYLRMNYQVLFKQYEKFFESDFALPLDVIEKYINDM